MNSHCSTGYRKCKKDTAAMRWQVWHFGSISHCEMSGQDGAQKWPGAVLCARRKRPADTKAVAFGVLIAGRKNRSTRLDAGAFGSWHAARLSQSNFPIAEQENVAVAGHVSQARMPYDAAAI